MFDQIACQHVHQTLGDQSDGRTQEVGAGGNAAEGKAEIDQVSGDDVDAPAENHGP